MTATTRKVPKYSHNGSPFNGHVGDGCWKCQVEDGFSCQLRDPSATPNITVVNGTFVQTPNPSVCEDINECLTSSYRPQVLQRCEQSIRCLNQHNGTFSCCEP